MEQAWARVAREAVSGQGQVVAEQWLVNTTVPGVDPADRRRLDVVVHGASPLGCVWCCDVTLVSPVRRDGTPIPLAADEDGVALSRARGRKERRYPELLERGPAQLVVLAAEVGGR